MTATWYRISSKPFIYAARKRDDRWCEKCDLPLVRGQAVARVTKCQSEKGSSYVNERVSIYHRICSSELVLEGMTR